MHRSHYDQGVLIFAWFSQDPIILNIEKPYINRRFNPNNNWADAWQNQQNYLSTQRRLRSAWASTQSDQSSLSAWRHLGSLATHRAHSVFKALIRGCQGWPESLLGPQVILLVLSCGGSVFSILEPVVILILLQLILESQHDKTNKVTVRPGKTQISLGIHTIWSESLLCT